VEEKILQDFKDYFGNDYNEEQESTLLFCIRRAIQSFKNKKNYPESYKEENIEKDMERYQMCIFDLALYWCVMQGYEFQNSHSESGVSRSWKSEEDIYALHNVIPIAKIV
jgi:hypothetical protein